MIRHARRGFTLLELLVVIGIILLLVAIGVFSYSKLDKVAGEKSTNTRLAICRAMLTEYETTATLRGIETQWPQPPAYYALPPYPPSVYNLGSSIGSPGDVNVGTSAGRYAGAVIMTGAALQVMSAVPNVKTMVAQLPSNALLTGSGGGPFTISYNGASISVPVVLDGWKDPIIYVPSGGMTGVTVGGVANKTVVSVDGRPFWASAGQDGNFTNGDDNLYSSPIQYK